MLLACRQKMETQALRSGQGDVIRNLQNKIQCLAIMPTGGGKSLLWLLTTHIWNTQYREGVGARPLTLVIVPFKALVISHLQESAPWFECLSSENSPTELQRGINTCSVIYTTPEKLVKNIAFQEIIVANADRIRLIALDEVHVVTEQALFRPDLSACIDLLHLRIPQAVRLAVTATNRLCDSTVLLAAAKMSSDAKIVRCSLDRSNCFISIAPMLDKKDKQRRTKFDKDHRSMFHAMDTPSKPRTIVFVCARLEAENLTLQLQRLCSQETHLQAHEICCFHADVDAQRKLEIINGFADSIRVVVATTAFGTGINYPDIRIIFHYNMPASLTEYMQNIGRGGRDGKRYECVLYFSYKIIHEQGAVWMNGTPVSQIPDKWSKYVEMIRFVLSTKCRRAFILPFFDALYDASTPCNSCDACAVSHNADAVIDISTVARIILKVIREFQRSFADGVVFTRVKDVITCHGNTKLRMPEADSNVTSRGIGAKSGFPYRNKAIWSIAVNYLMYSDTPLVAENVHGDGLARTFLIRKLVLTQAGTEWMGQSSQDHGAPLLIRHPVELLHRLHSDVQALFYPERAMSAQRSTPNSSKPCSVETCENPSKAHGLCQKHFMQKRRAAPKEALSTRLGSEDLDTKMDPFTSQPTFPTSQQMETSSRANSPTGCSTVQLLRPRPMLGSAQGSAFATMRPAPMSASTQTPSQTQVVRSTADTADDSSSSDDDDVPVLHTMVPRGTVFTDAQVHEGQFYPGITVVDDVVIDCHGKVATGAPIEHQLQRYEFAKGDPFAKFNSFPKQQIHVVGTTRKYKCLGCFICPQCRYREAPGVRAMRMSPRVFPFCPLHGEDSVTMIHESCTAIFEYVQNPDSSVTLTVTGGPHRHRLPPPTRLAPSTMAHIRALISDPSDGGKIAPMHVQMRTQGDEGARDQRRVAHAISKTITDVFGKDLGIAGLPKVKELTGGKPWVRVAQPPGTAMGDFQLVLCQLDEQKTLVSEVGYAHHSSHVTRHTSTGIESASRPQVQYNSLFFR